MPLKLSLGDNATALLPHAYSKIPPRYATSALTYIMGQALKDILEIMIIFATVLNEAVTDN